MPDVQKPFNERVRDTAIKYAPYYKVEFVERDYFILATGLKEYKYYILCANDNNYAHLIGVHPLISKDNFFNKCMDGSLTITDFDFIKNDQPETSVKGAVRGKIRSFPNLIGLFKKPLKAEESFVHNKVNCEIATSDGSLTLGFVTTTTCKTVPKTLLSKNELTAAAVPVELVLSRQSGTSLFDTIEQGNIEILRDKGVEHLLSEEFRELIVQKETSKEVPEAIESNSELETLSTDGEEINGAEKELAAVGADNE